MNLSRSAPREAPSPKAASGLLEAATPAWLLPGSNEARWLFRQDVAGYSSSHYTVTWDFQQGGANVSRSRQDYWIDVAQRAVLEYGSGIATEAKRTTSIIRFTRAVRSFALWACRIRLCESLAVITTDDVAAYERYVEGLNVTQASAEQRLGAVRALAASTDKNGRRMAIRPYRWRGELKRAARRIGRPNGRTPTLDPESFFNLLDHCLRLIEGSDEVVARADAYARIREASNRPGRVAGSDGHSAKQIIVDARMTYGACIVLAFSLLGSRKHQLALLEVEDIPGWMRSNGSDLTGRLSKTSNASGGTRTVQPVIPELKRGLEVVARLTGLDIERDSGPLFRCLELDQGLQSTPGAALDTNKVYRLITKVAKAAGVEIVVRPHMFRRAFAMLFVWRYEFGDLQHLSRFLHHNGLRQTMAYADGDDIPLFIADAEKKLARSIMERAITGHEPVGGTLGVLLQRLAHRWRSQTTVLRPEQVDDWLDARLVDGQFTLKAAPHGYCLILGDRARRSVCSTDGRTPNYGNRTDEHCAACGNFLVTDRSEQYWRECGEVHQRLAVTSRLSVVKQAAKQALVAVNRVLSSINRSRND